MKVLIATNAKIDNPINPYASQLIRALVSARGVDLVEHGSGEIWSSEPGWDIIHFHWPESLFNWEVPTRHQLAALDRRLANLAKTSTLVATIHNMTAKAIFGKAGNVLYETIYKRCSGFIHFGEPSKEFFFQVYGSNEWCIRARHVVIDHASYPYYLDLKTTMEIDPPLPQGRKLFLVFGAIREAKEEELARLAFQSAALPDASLVFAGQFRDEAVTQINLSALVKVTPKTILRYHRWIKDEEVTPFFDASSFVFISRIGRLNSGVVPLAFTYNKPVIGPAEGVIGNLLRRSGNLIYEPGDVQSAAEALQCADELSENQLEGLRRRIKQFACKYMSWDKHVQQHVDLYNSVLPLSAFGSHT